MSAIKTHYDNLQVARKASPEVIRAAYKGLTQRYHPDRHPEDRARYERVMKIINEAFEVLSDPRKRAEHDAWIARQETISQAEPRAQVEPGDNPQRGGRHSPAGAAPLHEPPTVNYTDAVRAFRQSRVTPATPEPARPEPQRASASESPQPGPTGAKDGKAPPRKHRSFRMTGTSESETHAINGWLALAFLAVMGIRAWIKHDSLWNLWPGLSVWHLLLLFLIVGGGCAVLFVRRHRDHPAQSEAYAKRSRFVTRLDWVAGIFAVACIFAAWPTWDTIGPLVLIVGLGMFVWLFDRAMKQQASIEASRLVVDGFNGSSNIQAKPMSAWLGLGIAAWVVLGIMAAMSLSGSRGGRVIVVLGGAALLVLCVRLLARHIKVKRAGARAGKDDEAWLLVVLVWGWLACSLTPHHLANLVFSDYVFVAAILGAAWIPANGAFRVLLSPGRYDLTWKRVSGYLFLMTLVWTIVFILRGADPSPMPTNALNNDSFFLSLASYLGFLIGTLLSAAVLAAILIGVGAAVSAAAGQICEQLKIPRPRAKVTALLVGWAIVPVALGGVYLANWVW